MRSAWWLVGFSVVMALVTGCPEETADGGGGSGGGGGDARSMCISNGTTNGLSEACSTCGCDKCPTQVAACQDALCQSVLSCGITNACSGTDCYCGIGKPVTECLTLASGPCMDQIIAASGVTVGTTPGCMTRETCAVALGTARTTSGNPLFQANEVSTCTKGSPAVMNAMGMVTTPAVAGMCMVECQ
jgi:hypothetical protein